MCGYIGNFSGIFKIRLTNQCIFDMIYVFRNIMKGENIMKTFVMVSRSSQRISQSSCRRQNWSICRELNMVSKSRNWYSLFMISGSLKEKKPILHLFCLGGDEFTEERRSIIAIDRFLFIFLVGCLNWYRAGLENQWFGKPDWGFESLTYRFIHKMWITLWISI